MTQMKSRREGMDEQETTIQVNYMNKRTSC